MPSRHGALIALAAACLTALGVAGCSGDSSAHKSRRQLLIVVDGLRADSVTAEVMPNLLALGQRGVIFKNHHSVYPTVTRVNASSISTGSYPETHGLMGNPVFFPQIDAGKFLDTGKREDLMRVEQATGGKLLMAPTLGETLQASGQRMLGVSSGSTGSAFLMNHKVAGGAILHYQYTLPESLQAEMNQALGPAPTDASPPGTLDQHAVDMFLKFGLTRIEPTVTIMWLGDHDDAAHANGNGSPEAIAILRKVDGAIKQVEEGLKAAGLFDGYDIWVTSDHGFSTYTGAADVASILKPLTSIRADGAPSVVADDGAIYVRDRNEQTVTTIVSALQKEPGVGAIFTSGPSGSFDGHLAGTISFDAIRWQHERSADILYSPDWTDAPNVFGMPGTTASDGVAGHGSSSPFDIHNTLIAAGPDLKRGVTVETPSGNVDFAPTFLTLLGRAIPATMQGRVLQEAFASGPDPATLTVKPLEHTVTSQDGSYMLTAFFSTVDSGGKSYRYFDRTRVARQPAVSSTRAGAHRRAK